jgi:signal transduction histidine kinase
VVTLARRIAVPTALLGSVICAGLAYVWWESAQHAREAARETLAIRTATALVVALEDASQDEERWVLALGSAPGAATEGRLREAQTRIAALTASIDRLALPPRADERWRELGAARASLDDLGREVLAHARDRTPERRALAVAKWQLLSSRTDALLKDLSTYHLRLLDRTVAELQERRTRALRTAALLLVAGLLAAVVLTAVVARAVVRPIVAVAAAAERIAATGRLAEVAGADRPDELGTLARAFNRMTERLVGANARLEEADRRKDEFLGMLSHELRNPLAPVRNAVELLRRAGPDAAQACRATEVISRQVDHLTRLVDELLDVTRIARGKIELRRERVDLAGVVARVCDDYRPLLVQQGLALTVDAPGPAWVDADPTRLAQVVGNLLHNSAKFTDPGGRVAVTLRAEGAAAEIRVVDTGAGMDAETLARAFEPFAQADRSLARSSGGLGLGLALVKGIVELHGGSAEASSAGLGQGSELVVRLPLASGPAAAAEGPWGAAAPAGPRRVLVVDDNVDAALTLADVVALFGHAAEVVHDGPAALAAARARRPDVVLCDIGLPGMSGYEVAEALRRELGPGVRLVAVSGYARPEDVARAHEAGFDAHVAKPADPAELERLLGA